MTSRNRLALGGSLLLLTLTGCPDPCLDDGLLQDDPAGCPAVSGGASESETETGTGTESDGDTCANGVLDGDESDVDCGGSCSNLCGDGDNCGGNEDCASDLCSDAGICVSPSCSNDVRDGDETDVDCGGSCPDGCGEGEGCEVDEDCMSANCLDDGTCGPAGSACDDAMLNGEETDVDCGGPDCDPCDTGETCMEGTDCASGLCEDMTCTEPSCDDGAQNGDETDIDCGGEACEPCGPGLMCTDGSDCTSGICNEDGTCAPPSCDDGVQNGDETDVDCGGSCGSTCEPGEGCEDFADCVQLVCDEDTEVCLDPACNDGAANGNETDVDCGGPDCDPCDEPGFCIEDTDCLSGICDGGQCVGPQCGDGVLNGSETDIDCGGPECAPCDDGETCVEGTDCVSEVCSEDDDTCTPATCEDGIQNQGESDVDCGGDNCGPCDNGETCEDDDDCTSTNCTPLGVCEDPTCGDGMQNGSETDVDCGGASCEGCDTGEDCNGGSDCMSGVCLDAGTCAAPTCDDGVQNGNESDVDCGGDTCDACDDGEDCVLTSDCMSMVCLGDVCQAASCNDGIQNGAETDVDCGGGVCQPCIDGGSCTDGTDCDSGVCVGNVCQTPTCDDSTQNGDETGVDCGGDTCGACPDGEGCEDAEDCQSAVCTGDVCQAPVCDDGVLNGTETDVDCGGDTCTGCDPGEMCIDGGDCLSAACSGNVCGPLLSVSSAPACNDSSAGPVLLSAVASGGTGGPYTYSWTPDDGTLDTPDQAETNADPAGFQTYTVTVDDGVNQATDTVVVLNSDPFDLQNNCTLFTADYGAGAGDDATITYDQDGERACELGNNEFGLHLCSDVVFENTLLTGTVEVTDDAGDNDWVGLIWGAQDESHFYSLVWKRGAQNFFGCTTPAGILVKRIEADTFASLGGADLYCPNNTARSTVLALPGATTPTGWTEGTAYDIEIEYTTTQSVVTVTEQGGAQVASFTIDDATFPSGSFGSTTLSQANACVGPLLGECLAG